MCFGPGSINVILPRLTWYSKVGVNSDDLMTVDDVLKLMGFEA